MEPYSDNPNMWSVGRPENPSSDDCAFHDEVSAKAHAKIHSGSTVNAVWYRAELDCLYFCGEMYAKK